MFVSLCGYLCLSYSVYVFICVCISVCMCINMHAGVCPSTNRGQNLMHMSFTLICEIEFLTDPEAH